MTEPSDLDRVNYTNIGLMGLSAILAYRFPFELFLLAYGVLGPLHYLTEISWLHDRNYYVKGKFDHWFLVGAGVLITLLFLGVFPEAPLGLGAALTFLAFLGALVFSSTVGTAARMWVLGAGALAGLVLAPFPAFREIFSVFLPTLIHVFIFTGLFILSGALKGRSLSGFLSLLVFVGVSVSFLFFSPPGTYRVGDYVRENYGYLREDGTLAGSFASLSLSVLQDFNLHDLGSPGASSSAFVASVNEFLYTHPIALSLTAFIAFAYTYHYLNWFSKTSVIRWHLVPPRRLWVILAVWAASVGIYAYDYILGLKWLFFLSFLHVLLEFPLNHLTFVQIGKEIKESRWGGVKTG
jgi:hypothetical protein